MHEGPWLDDDEQRAWRRTAAVMTLLPAALDAQLQRDAGLTQFSYLTLAMLSETPGMPGRRQHTPRTLRSIRTPAREAS